MKLPRATDVFGAVRRIVRGPIDDLKVDPVIVRLQERLRASEEALRIAKRDLQDLTFVVDDQARKRINNAGPQRIGVDDVERLFRAGERAFEDAYTRSGWKEEMSCPYDVSSIDGHWWTRGYAYAARLIRAIEAEKALKQDSPPSSPPASSFTSGPTAPTKPARERLAAERPAVTHRFALKDEGTAVRIYITAGMYPDGRLGEVFLVADSQGSFVSGLFDAIATLISITLQHGVPLNAITSKFRHTRFPPATITEGAPDIRGATSVLDYLGAWLDLRYPGGFASAEVVRTHDLASGERFEEKK